MSRHVGLIAAFGLGFLVSCLVLTAHSQDAKDKGTEKVLRQL